MGRQKNSRTKKDLWLRYAKTACISLGFLALGIAIALPGPTLPTLAYNLHTNIQSVSFVLPARAVGYLCGSVVSGLILSKFNQHLMLFFSLILTTIGLVFIPFANSVILLGVLMSTIGLSMGFLDTGGNVLCLKTWGDESGPYMQLLHFSFAAGATIAPFVAQPFILDSSQNLTLTDATESPKEGFKEVSWAYIIAASMSLLVALSFLWLSCTKANDLESNQENTIKSEGTTFRLKMLALLFFFFLVYVGMEVAFGLYIFTFSIKSSHKFSKDVATTINGVFWGSFAFGRFTSIFVSKFLSPNSLLRCDLVGTLTATILLLCFPLYEKTMIWLFWAAVLIYGMSMASIFPTGITWAEQYITINGKAASSLVVGAAVGEMICPLMVGQFVENNPMSLIYFTTGSTIISMAIYISLQIVASKRGKRNATNHTAVMTEYDSDQSDTLFEHIELLEGADDSDNNNEHGDAV